MAQEQDLTFITEDIPGADSFIQSGRSLRLSYMGRKEAEHITGILLAAGDPTTITEDDWKVLRDAWKREAEIAYPGEGDYKVWIVNPATSLPVPIGNLVEFIGGEIRENPGQELECTEYKWDLSALSDLAPVTLTYKNCRGQNVLLSDFAVKYKPTTSFCSLEPPVSTFGVITDEGECTIENLII